MENSKLKNISRRITALTLTGILAIGAHSLAEDKNKYSGKITNRINVTTNNTSELSTADDFKGLLDSYRNESVAFDVNSVTDVSVVVEKIYSQLKNNGTISVSKESILAWIAIFNDKSLEDYGLDSSKFSVYLQEFWQATCCGVMDIFNCKILETPIKASKTIVNFEELFANKEEREAVKEFSDARNNILETLSKNKNLDDVIIEANKLAYEHIMQDKKFKLTNGEVTYYLNLGYGAQFAIAMIGNANNTAFYDLTFKDSNGDIIDSEYLDQEVLQPASEFAHKNLKQICNGRNK